MDRPVFHDRTGQNRHGSFGYYTPFRRHGPTAPADPEGGSTSIDTAFLTYVTVNGQPPGPSGATPLSLPASYTVSGDATVDTIDVGPGQGPLPSSSDLIR